MLVFQITLVGGLQYNCSKYYSTTVWVNDVTLYWYSLVHFAAILQLYTRNRVAGKAVVIYCSSLIHAQKL